MAPLKQLLPIISIALLLLGACVKVEVKPVPSPAPQTMCQKIAGNYKVYDTLGNFLYDMKINYFESTFKVLDSLEFENINNNFKIGWQQNKAIESEEDYYVSLGHHDSLLDANGHSWTFICAGILPYNIFKNDTIRIRYNLSNCNYYVADQVPFRYKTFVEVAVKQH
jgi:hypothetical protein